MKHCLPTIWIVVCAAASGHGQDSKTSFGESRLRSTIHSVGIEWDIAGDSNHNAACRIRFRKQGASEWRTASPLLRIDYRGRYYGTKLQAFRHFNMLSGSLMFLEPATSYEVELTGHDPDGGTDRKTVVVATRPVPTPGKRSRTLYVVPGNGGGDGTRANPFKGLAEAGKAAMPGDTFLLHGGEYTGTILKTGGEPGRYIVWKSVGDGEVVVNRHVAINHSYVWIEGLSFQSSDEEDFGGVHVAEHGVDGIVVVRNKFRNCRYALSNPTRVWHGDEKDLNTGWYFADNIVDGGPTALYGTRVYMLADSDVCHNRITTTLTNKGGDAISLRYCTNVDVYNNDMRDLNDDAVEPDYSYGNIRIYRNRIINPRWHGISFQPTMCSPWYILQNEFVLMAGSRKARPFKTNIFDRIVLLNNTFVVRGRYAQTRADFVLRSFSRNNLWIHLYDNADEETNPTGALWSGHGGELADGEFTTAGQTIADWNSDVDYDGFAWEGAGLGKFPFWWDGAKPDRFRNLKSLFQTIGVEEHGVSLKRTNILALEDLADYTSRPWSDSRLVLKEGCKAIDAGIRVPNLGENYTGKAPDLGAHEFGQSPVRYGPRPIETSE